MGKIIKKQLVFLTRVLLTLPLIGLGLPLKAGGVADRPNMLLIICDDLNDSVGGMGGHPQAKTPNIDRLMARGVRFLNAQANAPLCGPSRASLWSGLAPQTTGYYGYDQQKNHWRKNPVLKDSVTLFELAAARGYLIQATGKIHHNGHEDWSIFKNADGTEGFGVRPSFGPYPWDGSQNKKQWGCLHPDLPKCWHDENVSWDSGFGPIRDISKEFGGKGSWILNRGKPYRYVSADDRDLMPDEQSAEYAVGVLKKNHSKPFLLAIGFNRPHSPMYVPEKYFKRFPLDSIQLTPLMAGDVDDCARCLVEQKDLGTQGYGFKKYRQVYEAGGLDLLRRWTQAYLACVSFVDDQIGTVLTALENSPYAENTLVVLTSDHGYHMGEKEQLFKNSVWEESMRTPLVVAGPGVARGRQCDRPVSLIDIYPTCADYGQWTMSPNVGTNGKPLDGHSLRPLLEKPDENKWAGEDFALSVVASNRKLEVNEPGKPAEQHWSLRTVRYRYILCRNGEEELYDHQADPHEWRNVSADPEHAEEKRKLKQKLMKALKEPSVHFPWTFPPVEKLPVLDGLADPFVKPDGSRVSSPSEWPAQRAYLKAMLAHYLYGSMPPRPVQFDVKRLSGKPVFDGKAMHERYLITLNRNQKSASFHFELMRPLDGKRFPGIIKNSDSFFEDKALKSAQRDTEAAREAVARGYLLCKFKREEVAADEHDNRNTGVFPLYPEYNWGAIAAWAWAHGVVADALDQLELLDMKRIVATGHSRGGKTALCAGIYDERIAITAPNASGTGGTGSLRFFEAGQKPQRLIEHKTAYPHWWVSRFFDFGNQEERLPFDAHTAKALIAPRALINTKGRQDYWANPYGTELTYRAADKVYEWLGAKGQQGIHWREGKHAQGQEDWLALLDFADWTFFNKKPRRRFSTLAYPDAKMPVTWSVPYMSKD